MKKLEDKFMTEDKFSFLVENVVKNNNGLINYIEAVLIVCEEMEIELEKISKLISDSLKSKLKVDAEKMNYMNKQIKGVLPI